MEPKRPGSGTASTEQTAATKPPTTNTTATTATNQGRTTKQDTAILSPPGKTGKQQGTVDQSDGR